MNRSKGYEIGFVNFYRHRFKDQFDGHNEAVTVFPTHDNPVETCEWTGLDANASTGSQERVRQGTQSTTENFSNALHFGFWDRRRAPTEAQKLDETARLLYSQTIGCGEADKNIAREKRQMQANFAVFPLADGFILRQETFYASLNQLICYGAFMIRTSVSNVPILLEAGVKKLGWELWTRRFWRCVLIDYVREHGFHSFALSLTGNL
jgi:hypothetical protein